MLLKELKIEITNQCPLKCIHCSTDAEMELGSFLSAQEIEKIVNQARELSCEKVLFSGGEPLLHPHLETLIEYCHSKQLEPKLYTSGIESAKDTNPVSIDRLKFMKSKGLQQIAFSLYASRYSIHDLITGIEGSFKATVTSIKNAVQAGITTEVHFAATRINITELVPLADFVLSVGVSRISVLRFVPQGRGKCNAEKLMPTHDDFVALRSAIAAIRQSSYVSLRVGSPFNILLLGGPSACTAGRERMIIDARGLAYPCDALKHIALFEHCNNALTTPLSQIMEKDSLFKIVRRSTCSDSCRSCPDFKICRGGCTAQCILATGDLIARDPGCLQDSEDKNYPFGNDRVGNLTKGKWR